MYCVKFFDLKYNDVVKVSGFLSFCNITPFIAVHWLSVQGSDQAMAVSGTLGSV